MLSKRKVEKLLEKVRLSGRIPTPELEASFYELTPQQAAIVDRRLQNAINRSTLPGPKQNARDAIRERDWAAYFANPPYAPADVPF